MFRVSAKRIQWAEGKLNIWDFNYLDNSSLTCLVNMLLWHEGSSQLSLSTSPSAHGLFMWLGSLILWQLGSKRKHMQSDMQLKSGRLSNISWPQKWHCIKSTVLNWSKQPLLSHIQGRKYKFCLSQCGLSNSWLFFFTITR
jgi:hypothetical protein